MSSVQFSSITTDEGQQFITAFAGGRLLGPVDDSHPNFTAIKDALGDSLDGYPTDEVVLVKLFDVAATVAAHFESLSDRIKVANGRVYLDGDEVENSLTKQIVRFMDEGVEDWKPLVLFFEKVLSNPNEHSREQLYTWLDKHDFTIDSEGDIVGYKGVRQAGDSYESISRGREQVLVDNVPHTGAIPNPIGSTVEMSRTLVHHDPAVGCSVGLHVGTYEYASSFGSVCLEVRVNPRDVVSVPTDCSWQKVRTCRYRIVDVIERKHDVALIADADVDNAEDTDLVFASGDVIEDANGVEWRAGDRGADWSQDPFTVLRVEGDRARIRWDDTSFGDNGEAWFFDEDFEECVRQTGGDPYADVRGEAGRFTQGRPGSRRDPSTGRFS